MIATAMAVSQCHRPGDEVVFIFVFGNMNERYVRAENDVFAQCYDVQARGDAVTGPRHGVTDMVCYR